MHCLYCHKRLWLFFSKERLFCSKLHEAAYYDELSAMDRLMEFTVPAEPPKGPATADQKRSQREHESRIPMAWPVAIPPLCNFVGNLGRPKPVAPDFAAAAVRLEAEPFAGKIQTPSSRSGLIAFTLPSAIEADGEIATMADERTTFCRVRPKRGRKTSPQSPGAFSSRMHRRKLR
jgi:hypothetical protein